MHEIRGLICRLCGNTNKLTKAFFVHHNAEVVRDWAFESRELLFRFGVEIDESLLAFLA